MKHLLPAELQNIKMKELSLEDQAAFQRLQETACMGQGCTQEGVVRVQNTQYENPLSNYAVYCEDCQAATDAYWDDRWSEYWSNVL
jgi:hypothetical protein